jgi:exodeoxyribonuclease-3
MKIATWNVNSIKARIDTVLTWFKQAAPDVALLQEIKCEANAFPRLEFEALGYNCAVLGQKSYNGVAILSKARVEDVVEGLPGDPVDDHARYIEGVISTKAGALRVASIYLPNGNPPDSDKFSYKLKWMDRLIAHVRALREYEEILVIGGDYNVIPTADDVFDPLVWQGDALFRLESRDQLRRLINMGFTDAFRACNAEAHQYTFWDYQAGCWQKNNGIRIDHLLLSPQAADKLATCAIDKHTRAWEKPSDHVPVWCELDVAA